MLPYRTRDGERCGRSDIPLDGCRVWEVSRRLESQDSNTGFYGATLNAVAKQKKLRPVHPGEILRDELKELHMSGNALALALRIPAIRVTEIIEGKRSIGAVTALRLALYFGTSAQMWMNLQSRFDLETA